MDIRSASDREMIREALWRNLLAYMADPSVPKMTEQQEGQFTTAKPYEKDVIQLRKKFNIQRSFEPGDPVVQKIVAELNTNRNLYPELPKEIAKLVPQVQITDLQINEMINIALSKATSEQLQANEISAGTTRLTDPKVFLAAYNNASSRSPQNFPLTDRVVGLINFSALQPSADIATFTKALNASITPDKKMAYVIASLIGYGGQSRSASYKNMNSLKNLMLRNAVINAYLNSLE